MLSNLVDLADAYTHTSTIILFPLQLIDWQRSVTVFNFSSRILSLCTFRRNLFITCSATFFTCILTFLLIVNIHQFTQNVLVEFHSFLELLLFADTRHFLPVVSCFVICSRIPKWNPVHSNRGNGISWIEFGSCAACIEYIFICASTEVWKNPIWIQWQNVQMVSHTFRFSGSYYMLAMHRIYT